MKNLFLIFFGGGVGSVFRFLISNYTQKLWNISSLLITGFCGGYTTFSTFSVENYSLWQNGSYNILFLYVFLSVILGFFAVILGFQIMKN